MKHNLQYFVLRGESKRLYKNFMKLTRKIDDKQQARDLRLWIRDDFKINKHLVDEPQPEKSFIKFYTHPNMRVQVDLK